MRAFVAVEIDNADIIQKIKSIQETVTFKAKPVRVDQIHFTLQFLGEISKEKAEKVKSVLLTVDFQRFSLTIGCFGVFPNTKNPRIVWLGVDKYGGEKLSNVAKNVNSVLSPIGFNVDKQFSPHLTIFRIKTKIDDITNELLKFKDVEFGKQMVSKIILKKSELSKNGPEYTNLVEVNGKP
tara:strand:+ start:1173 stop:1715 length:543 start_codon:yes stop_codon:yes gene_type:complete